MHHPSLTDLPAFRALSAHHTQARDWQLRSLCAQDTSRLEQRSIEAAGLVPEYSRILLDRKAMQLLVQLARECSLAAKCAAMCAGE